MGFNLHAESNDPPEVRNIRVHLIAVIMSMGSLAMGYDTSVIGGTLALDSFTQDFGLRGISPHQRDTLQGNIVSTFQAGTFFGALLTFPIGEKIGRKRAIMFAVAVFLVGGTLMTASDGRLPLIYAGRAIAGFGIGSVSLLVPVYIAETSPPSIRGRLVGIFEIFSQGGGMLGFWINYIVNRTIPTGLKTQWIVPLGLQLARVFYFSAGSFSAPSHRGGMGSKKDGRMLQELFPGFENYLLRMSTFNPSWTILESKLKYHLYPLERSARKPTISTASSNAEPAIASASVSSSWPSKTSQA
ncbi:hypothetical protein ABW19_dt0208062 [Dactylella cylindrospora]|nr:hypothetical protein ABW19_dt0208062 [Dactylella cylindrospora]